MAPSARRPGALLRVVLCVIACCDALVRPGGATARPVAARRRVGAGRRDVAVFNLNQHIDAVAGQFEATDVSGLPDWVQESIVKGGLNVLTFDEANASVLSFQVLIIGLAMYVSQQRYGAAGAQGQTQLTAEQMREERRRRSRFVDEPETLDDVDVSSWFDDDDDDDAAQRR